MKSTLAIYLAYCFAWQVMPLENEMKTPKAYVGKTGVLSRAFTIIVILYIAMGLFGWFVERSDSYLKCTIFYFLSVNLFNRLLEIRKQYSWIDHTKFGD